ncbi:U32 family peptidase [Aerolutibacter ruishenii]|uniref:Ubiquinone biosynthesis protein UbiV n=1 Tax=Aerolutibacter ruishenii TaxID=686800 RepID=A0A562LY77_9GAMM|nr:U32 family peptidase [Lysobacter ruishenii]TWI12503.1 collagenase-like PrtC family protease [Lysobacter ruishenii]
MTDTVATPAHATAPDSAAPAEQANRLKISLGPLQYFWPRETTLAFYREAIHWPVDIVYLGETVCSKRRELRTVEWIELAEELATSGKQIVLSSLALIEAESELSVLNRQISHGGFWVEANDLSAVQLCREKGLPFVAGPALNVYNHRALAMLVEDGLRRWVPGVEQGEVLIRELKDALEQEGGAMPELEVIAWGRLPLSYSARCFTARALDIAKDQCGFRCIDYPDGLPLATREGRPFLRINGIQVQGEEVTDLGPELPDLRALGVDILRLYPQAEGMEAVVRHFDLARNSLTAPPRIGQRNGYWHGEPGMRPVAAA